MTNSAKDWLYRLLIWLGPHLIRLIASSCRISTINFEPTRRLIEEKKSLLFCLWHGRMFIPIFLYRNQKIAVMISRHADGEMIARIVMKLGYGTVRGSSKQGGREAFYELLAHLKNGGSGCMLPDGPTGPRHYFKPGTLMLLQQSGSYMIPITYAAKPCWRFRSWDHFVLPKPFARCIVVYGDPIQITRELSETEAESQRLLLENMMVELVKKAESTLYGSVTDV